MRQTLAKGGASPIGETGCRDCVENIAKMGAVPNREVRYGGNLHTHPSAKKSKRQEEDEADDDDLR